MHIGKLYIKNPIFLAPMAGVTDYAFRVIAKEFGAGIVYSEFVSAHGIIRKNEKTLKMIQFSDFERPIGIQIFGDSPEVMRDAAKVVYEKFKPNLIDINYGCPVPKVTKKGAGSAALKDLCLMEDITQAVVESVPKIPVTVKMRSGWNAEKIVSTEAGIKLEKIGVKAITLHPRTTVQMYKSKANWDLIKELMVWIGVRMIYRGGKVRFKQNRNPIVLVGPNIEIRHRASGTRRRVMFHAGKSAGNSIWKIHLENRRER